MNRNYFNNLINFENMLVVEFWFFCSNFVLEQVSFNFNQIVYTIASHGHRHNYWIWSFSKFTIVHKRSEAVRKNLNQIKSNYQKYKRF